MSEKETLAIAMCIVDRCRAEGATAANRHEPVSSCPYKAEQELEQAGWVDGWVDGWAKAVAQRTKSA